ncbi:MAG: hypothetical protein PHX93_04625 [Candidatus Peribacteraceae bacterium]|jgi:hypothetical protein|nr:hypothetical protein [Candidatus Peribacteraceae bacterium]
MLINYIFIFYEKNKDSMHWIFRHCPGANNENDYRSGMVTECVTRQLGNDAFWAYLDLPMKQTGSPLPLNALLPAGSAVGAETAKLQTFVFLNYKTRSMRIVEGINTMEYMQAVPDDVSQ